MIGKCLALNRGYTNNFLPAGGEIYPLLLLRCNSLYFVPRYSTIEFLALFFSVIFLSCRVACTMLPTCAIFAVGWRRESFFFLIASPVQGKKPLLPHLYAPLIHLICLLMDTCPKSPCCRSFMHRLFTWRTRDLQSLDFCKCQKCKVLSLQLRNPIFSPCSLLWKT